MEVPETTITTSLSKEELVVEHETTSGSEEDEDQSGPSSADDEESEAKSLPSSEDRSPADDDANTDIPENENANGSSNATTSPMKTSPDSSDVNNDVTNGDAKVVQSLVFSSGWSESLKSPTDVLVFSPSELGSCHGLGLQLAVERSVSTALFLGNVSLFLSSTATIYEQLGINLIKMAQFERPQQQLSRETLLNDDLQSLYEDILSLGSGFRGSAAWYRTSLIAPLKKMLFTNGTERDSATKRYKEQRRASVEARKLALASYSRTTKVTKNAESEIQRWFSTLQQKRTQVMKEEHNETEETVDAAADLDLDLPWEKALKRIGKKENAEEATMRLIQRLKLVQTCRMKYNESVEKENICVRLSQEKESLALSKAQKSEEDQLNFFVEDILSQVYPKDENARKLPVVRANVAMSDSDRPYAEGFEKKGIELLSTLKLFKQQSVPYEEGMGVMDAETLGLPEELGIQRDKIKSSFSARENRIEVTEIVIKLFEEISGVTSKLSLRMLSQITNQRRKNASEGRSSESFYSSMVGSIWRKTLSVFEDEAKLISGTGLKLSKLEKWLASSKRMLENEIELDDAAWKRVCDAARMEMKLESRYKQTKQNGEKVRMRASSRELSLSQRGSFSSDDNNSPHASRKRTDSSGSVRIPSRSNSATRSSSGTHLTPNRVGRAFFKGGEAFLKGGEAMKKLTESAIVSISQISLNEVDQKEAKNQLALEEAVSEKKGAVLAYSSCTKERIEKIDSEDDSGWKEMRETILKLAESIGTLKEVRCTIFQNRISQELDSSFQLLIDNMGEWSENVQKKIHQSDRVSSSTSSPEYALSLQPISSDDIDPLLGMTENDLTIPKLKFDIELTNELPNGQPIDNQKVTSTSTTDIQGDDGSDKELKKTEKPMVSPSPNEANNSQSGEEKQLEPIRTDPDVVAGKEISPELKAFITQFWSKKPKDEKVPEILGIYTSVYRPKERITFLTPNLQGRLYVTSEAIYFLGAEKNFTLQWEIITSVEREKGFMGSVNETDLVVSYRSRDTVSSFLLCRLKERNKVVANLQRVKAEYEQSKVSPVSKSNSATGAQLPPIPPDPLLKKMEIVVSKTIKNVSIESIFENVWADRTESFYGSWLKEEECFDIGMGEWEIAEPQDKFKNEWCKEKYDQQRLVTFKFNRTTHLYIGPPVAIVKQRHFIRIEGNDKCILAISADFDGIPYADTFAVEMRWVATRKGTNDALVQVGLFVNFKKTTMLKSQIKSGTIAETKHVHLRLFDAVKRACKNLQDGESDNDNDKDEEVEEEIESIKAEPNLLAGLGRFVGSLEVSTIVSLLGLVAFLSAGRYFSLALFGNAGPSDIQRLENHIQELKHEVRALHKSLDLLTLLLKENIENRDLLDD